MSGKSVLLFIALLLPVATPASTPVQDDFSIIQKFFPDADHAGKLEGVPPAAPVYNGDQLLGYVYYTDDVIKIPAYSGKPIRTLVGFGSAVVY
jgi:NosR/NirI family nitrous oxide reductase transcriptional regulator